jgi:hypothetical protein
LSGTVQDLIGTVRDKSVLVTVSVIGLPACLATETGPSIAAPERRTTANANLVLGALLNTLLSALDILRGVIGQVVHSPDSGLDLLDQPLPSLATTLGQGLAEHSSLTHPASSQLDIDRVTQNCFAILVANLPHHLDKAKGMRLGDVEGGKRGHQATKLGVIPESR